MLSLLSQLSHCSFSLSLVISCSLLLFSWSLYLFISLSLSSLSIISLFSLNCIILLLFCLVTIKWQHNAKKKMREINWSTRVVSDGVICGFLNISLVSSAKRRGFRRFFQIGTNHHMGVHSWYCNLSCTWIYWFRQCRLHIQTELLGQFSYSCTGSVLNKITVAP